MLAIAEMEGEIGYGHRGKQSYLQYIGTESRPRESRVLFRYCLNFNFKVVNYSKRCFEFGPQHASCMQRKRNYIIAFA